MPERLDLVEGPLEELNLWLPVAFLALAPLQYTAFYDRWSAAAAPLAIALSELLFLNLVHTALGYALILGTPEGARWRRAQRSTVLPGLAASVALVALASAGLQALAFRLAPAPPGVWSAARAVARVVVPWLFAQHGLAQVRGIGLAYNELIRRSFPLSEAELARMREVERRERPAYAVLTAASALALACWDARFSTRWGPAAWLQHALSAVACAAAAWIYRLNLGLPRVRETRKPLFLARLALAGLMGCSFPAYWGRLCTHGVEYLQVFRKAAAGSDGGRSGALAAALAALLVAVLAPYWASFGLRERLELSADGVPWWAKLAFVYAFAQTLVHYACDRWLFRARDPASRELLGLLSAPARPGRPVGRVLHFAPPIHAERT